jgi:hypothetical protein
LSVPTARAIQDKEGEREKWTEEAYEIRGRTRGGGRRGKRGRWREGRGGKEEGKGGVRKGGWRSGTR